MTDSAEKTGEKADLPMNGGAKSAASPPTGSTSKLAWLPSATAPLPKDLGDLMESCRSDRNDTTKLSDETQKWREALPETERQDYEDAVEFLLLGGLSLAAQRSYSALRRRKKASEETQKNVNSQRVQRISKVEQDRSTRRSAEKDPSVSLRDRRPSEYEASRRRPRETLDHSYRESGTSLSRHERYDVPADYHYQHPHPYDRPYYEDRYSYDNSYRDRNSYNDRYNDHYPHNDRYRREDRHYYSTRSQDLRSSDEYRHRRRNSPPQIHRNYRSVDEDHYHRRRGREDSTVLDNRKPRQTSSKSPAAQTEKGLPPEQTRIKSPEGSATPSAQGLVQPTASAETRALDSSGVDSRQENIQTETVDSSRSPSVGRSPPCSPVGRDDRRRHRHSRQIDEESRSTSDRDIVGHASDEDDSHRSSSKHRKARHKERRRHRSRRSHSTSSSESGRRHRRHHSRRHSRRRRSSRDSDSDDSYGEESRRAERRRSRRRRRRSRSRSSSDEDACRRHSSDRKRRHKSSSRKKRRKEHRRDKDRDIDSASNRSRSPRHGSHSRTNAETRDTSPHLAENMH